MEEKEGFLIYSIDIDGVKFIEWLAINWVHGVFQH